MNNLSVMDNKSDLGNKILSKAERDGVDAAIRAKGLTPSSWARVNNFSIQTVLSILNGNSVPQDPARARVYPKVIAALHRDGYLADPSLNETPDAA